MQLGGEDTVVRVPRTGSLWNPYDATVLPAEMSGVLDGSTWSNVASTCNRCTQSLIAAWGIWIVLSLCILVVDEVARTQGTDVNKFAVAAFLGISFLFIVPFMIHYLGWRVPDTHAQVERMLGGGLKEHRACMFAVELVIDTRLVGQHEGGAPSSMAEFHDDISLIKAGSLHSAVHA